jgi:glycosyltransferase involved in cell wall biosynthesis
MVRQIEGWLHQRMDVIVGNSRAVVNQILQEGVPEARARLIYNGVDTLSLPARKAARAALDIHDSTFVGAVVANLLPYKGYHDLIEALSIVEHELPISWSILIAGRDCGIGSELQSFSVERAISHRVRFLGQYLDVPQLLAAADFGLLTPYGNEGFSNSILEAMSASLPMIVTDVGGNAEAVLDGETGFVVPPRNSRAIADAIVRLARSPGLRTKFGMAARRRVEENFTLDHCIQCHLNLYEELLDKLGSTSGTDSRSFAFLPRLPFGNSKR